MAHRLLSERSSKCATPHGHNEFISVTLQSDAPAHWGGANCQAPFADLKRHWHQFIDQSLDHALQLGANDPLIAYFKAHEPDLLPRLLVIDGDPTTEAVAIALYQKLTAILKAFAPEFRCVRLELEETPTNRILLDQNDLMAAPTTLGAWCHRADLSLNDLIEPSMFGAFH